MPANLVLVQTEAVNDLRAWLSKTGMDLTTATPNPDLAFPIAKAIMSAGGTVTDPASVSDSDVASVDFFALMRYVRIYLIERIWGRWAEVDQKDGDTEQKLSQLTKALEDKQKALLEELKDPELAATLEKEGSPRAGQIKEGARINYDPLDPLGYLYGYPLL